MGVRLDRRRFIQLAGSGLALAATPAMVLAEPRRKLWAGADLGAPMTAKDVVIMGDQQFVLEPMEDTPMTITSPDGVTWTLKKGELARVDYDPVRGEWCVHQVEITGVIRV